MYLKTLALASTVAVTGSIAHAQMAPFGDEESIAYAAQLWVAMQDAKLAGDGMIKSFPYGAVGKVFRGATGAVSAFWISGFAFWVGILSLFWPKIRFLGGLAPGITLLRSGFYPRQAQPAASGYVQ